MTEVVWVAFVSAGSAIAVALMTQFLATRAASKSADRADKREALQWQRTEALRLADLARNDAQAALAWERSEALRLQALQDMRLRELWGHVLVARWQVLDTLERVPVQGRPARKSADVSAAGLPASAAGQAYAVALLGLAAVRPWARAFYVATSDLQLAMQAADEERIKGVVSRWSDSFKTLEDNVAALADGQLMDATGARGG